ncbi:c-type cytochrome [Zobellella taiwanensis]|uniref:Cytochrome C n=1 Tax=Zobellella taiwanensis TaxID=347535 RepID=A0A2P7R422_9GAMM|nr:cytochrome c [Zobellella taiwanensis]PSJ44967.1 cytochrome C [Zobellella taiwanensis]
MSKTSDSSRWVLWLGGGLALLLLAMIAGHFLMGGSQMWGDMPHGRTLSAQGQATYGEYCASCHGADLRGTPKGPPFIHKVYEPSHHGDEAFYRAAANGVRAHHWRFGDMPPVEGISRDEVSDIIGYVREQQRQNGIR